MRVLVLHSDVPADAPPEDLDTLVSADAVADSLRERGHSAILAPFVPGLEEVRALVSGAQADIVFNMVESVSGSDTLAAIAPAMLEKLGIRYTGNTSSTLALAGDKVQSKIILRAVGLPTPDWSEPPHWTNFREGRRHIVKSATEDASLGLDDAAIVTSVGAAAARAHRNFELWGGRWFAEAFVEGREFNVALLECNDGLEVLPIAEMSFRDWPNDKPRIVGYRAKWDQQSAEAINTVRIFGVERNSPALAGELTKLARNACRLFGVRGFARVDFRVDAEGHPSILEINPNPCLDPKAGFVAAANSAGLSFAETVGRILDAAIRGDVSGPAKK